MDTLELVFEGRRELFEERTLKDDTVTLRMPKGIYTLELKYGKSADEALRQIDERGYARKYALYDRPVTKVGLAFSQEERNITEWKSEGA